MSRPEYYLIVRGERYDPMGCPKATLEDIFQAALEEAAFSGDMVTMWALDGDMVRRIGSISGAVVKILKEKDDAARDESAPIPETDPIPDCPVCKARGEVSEVRLTEDPPPDRRPQYVCEFCGHTFHAEE